MAFTILCSGMADELRDVAKKLNDSCGTGFVPGRSRIMADGSLLFGVPFGSGSGHEEDNDGKEHHEYTKKQIRNGESVVHRDNPFFDKDRLNVQHPSVASIPVSIAIQSILSTELLNNGVNTPTARNTFPALSKILDNRANWSAVNTGSFQMYRTPNDSITSERITQDNPPSINFSFLPIAYAGDTNAPIGGGGVRCAAARVAAIGLHTIADFSETSLWQAPTWWVTRQIRGVGEG